VNASAVLALLGDLYAQLSALRQENEQLKQQLADQSKGSQ
jgi:cell division septum initiation protein DivIVA